VAADYAPLHPADDMARCLRYYEVFGDGSAVTVALGGYCAASNNLAYYFAFRALKPVTPSATKMGTWTVSNCSQPLIGSQDKTGFQFYATATTTNQVAFSNSGVGGPPIISEANP